MCHVSLPTALLTGIVNTVFMNRDTSPAHGASMYQTVEQGAESRTQVHLLPGLIRLLCFSFFWGNWEQRPKQLLKALA